MQQPVVTAAAVTPSLSSTNQSLPDVVTFTQPHSVNQSQTSDYQSNFISHSTSEPSSLTSAASHFSEHVSKNSQHTGQIGFTIDFDDSGVSWNLKSNLNQFLPNHRKAKMEERRVVSSNEDDAGDGCEYEKCSPSAGNNCNNQESPDNPCNAQVQSSGVSEINDDKLSSAGTYIVDDENEEAAKQPAISYIDLNNQDVSVDRSMMDNFLDATAFTSSETLNSEENGKNNNTSAIFDKNIDVVTPVASDDESVFGGGNRTTDNLFGLSNESCDPDGEWGISDNPNSKIKNAYRSATPTSEAKHVSRIPLSRKHSFTKSSPSNVTENKGKEPVTSTNGSLVNHVTLADLKNKANTPKSSGGAQITRGKSPIANRPPTPTSGHLTDVDRKLSEMEAAVKKSLKLSPGDKDKSINVKKQPSVPPSPTNSRASGNFSRCSPVRRSAGPRFANSNSNKDFDAVSVSSSEQGEPKSSISRKPVISANPQCSIRMNKAMQLRMMKLNSDADDSTSHVSDNGSSKSAGLHPMSFSRNSPAYQSLPVKRNASAGPRAPLSRNALLPNKTVAKTTSATTNKNAASSATRKTTVGAQRQVALEVMPPRTPDETSLSSFDKLVLSSIDQLSKKLRISSLQLLESCRQLKNENGEATLEQRSVDIPKLKTGCKEISTILYELRVVERNIDFAYSSMNTSSADADSSGNAHEEDEYF